MKRVFIFGVIMGLLAGGYLGGSVTNIFHEFMEDKQDAKKCNAFCKQILLPDSAFDAEEKICLCKATSDGKDLYLELYIP